MGRTERHDEREIEQAVRRCDSCPETRGERLRAAFEQRVARRAGSEA